MTAVHDPLELKVQLTSPTSAQAGDITLEAGTASIQESIISHAHRRARDAGRPVRLVVTAPTGKTWSRLVQPPESHDNGRQYTRNRGRRQDRGDEGRLRGGDRWLPAQQRRQRGQRLASGWRDRVADRAELRATAERLWQHRGVRYGAAAAVVVAAFAAGMATAPDGPEKAPERPLETFSLSGPGDRTSGPGVIQASNYAYYVWPRTADGVAGFWSPGAAGPPDELQKLIDKAAAERMQFHLEVTETPDPLVYDARLTITTSDGGQHPYAQRFRLTRADDGKFLIASKSDCDTSCPPI